MPGAARPPRQRKRRRGSSGKASSPITLGRAAALAGLYLVCVAIGGVAGLYLDRQGVFDGATTPRIADLATPAQAIPAQQATGQAIGRPADGQTVSLALAPPRAEAPAAAVRPSFPYTPRSEGPGDNWRDLLALLESDVNTDMIAPPVAEPALAPAQAAGSVPADPMPENTGLETNSSEIPPMEAPADEPPGSTALAALPSLPAPEPRGASPAPDLRGAAPPWQRYAVKVAGVPGRPMLAVVIDDVGLNRPGARRAFKLPAPLTMALMSYAEHLPALAEEAHAAGHELLVHLPMEPDDLGHDPGPQALLLDLPAEEQARRVAWALDRFEGFVGINNHMGSRFTADAEAMGRVIAALRARGLLFLDSRTAPDSKGAALAERAGVPFAERDIFIDNQYEDRSSIRRQLDAAERIARSRGFAVAIGHPHANTLAVLERWLPEAQKRGIQLVPISAIVRLRLDLALQPVARAG